MASVALKRTGQKMPLVGFGLWKVDNDTCAQTVYKAIQAGYRLFDGAGDYGNEKEAGEGVRKAIADGLVKREELFITSKLWNTFHKYEHAKTMAKHQLKLWGLDYFDLFLIHFPISLKYVDPAHRYPPGWFNDEGKADLVDIPLRETWTALEELVDEGLAKNIGLSNSQSSLIMDVNRYARIQPAVLQVELHPYLSQEALVKWCDLVDIKVTAYSSFGPQSYLELGYQTAHNLLDHDAVRHIAAAKGKTSAQVLLRWATQRGIAVIPKSNNHERLVANFECNSFDLTPEEFAVLNGLNINLRLNSPAELDPRMEIFG